MLRVGPTSESHGLDLPGWSALRSDMANESQFIPDGGKSHSHQKYVVAQGNVVLRVLPREAHAQIRHCEIALVENNGRPQGEFT